jgi:hypothetical protein
MKIIILYHIFIYSTCRIPLFNFSIFSKLIYMYSEVYTKILTMEIHGQYFVVPLEGQDHK